MEISSVEKYYYNGEYVSLQLTYSNGEKYSVPLDEANRHYQEILEWVENGGVIVDNGA